MTTDELERIASTDAEMPEVLALPEQLLFLTLRTLYQNFHSGAVNRDRAKREKQRIYTAYKGLVLDQRIMQRHKDTERRLSHQIGELHRCGCENCKKLLDIFTGIDRRDIPEDIREVHARNERLVELVKERSERNAELSTVIDRVRRALEKNDIEKIRDIVRKEN